MNIGLLGAGWFGREAHLKNLLRLPNVNVIAASSRSQESLNAARELAGNHLQTFHDWRDVLKIDSVDAVIISLTNDQHHAAAIAAFEAGKHVLCEKPLGLTIRECQEIIAASQASGCVLQIGHEMRFQQLYQRMKQLVASDRIGPPQIMWCREYRGPMRPGWRSSEALTGGLLLEKNCHHFDLFNWILDAKPVRVAAFGGRNVLLDRELPDNAQVLVEFEGGRRAVLEICLFAPTGGDCEIGLVASNGRIDSRNQALHLEWHVFEPREHHQETVPDSDDEAGFRDAAGRVDRGIRAELIHFLECCQNGTTPLNDGRAALMTVAVCLAGQESLRRGEVVAIDEVLML
ncbi:MAG: Gfo/Idh/MocA family oxidoreductase [Planctomycetaceae bacterium]|nr:Gfo/Idh/MocA family oxidoreductase [Planctomycetaceae bacterium]